LYHWIDHPGFEREADIVRRRAPHVAVALARDIAAAAEALRGLDLYKPPGVAESIDWAVAIATLGRQRIDEATVDVTLGTVVKYREDQATVRGHGLGELVRTALARSA
jgi:MoxR-like ATPase